MKAEDTPLVIGCVFLGMGVFYAVWYPLHVRSDHPSAIFLFPYVVALASVIGGFVLVRRYSRILSGESGLAIIVTATICLVVFFLTIMIHPHDM